MEPKRQSCGCCCWLKEGFFLFKTTGTHHSPNEACNNGYYSVDPEFADVDMAFSIVLAALRSGTEIEVGVDPTSCRRGTVQHLGGKIVVKRIRAK